MSRDPDKQPWYIKRGPTKAYVAQSEVDIEDHLGKSSVYVTAWANGEGYDIHLTRDKQPDQRIEVTECEWQAMRKAMRATVEAEDEARARRLKSA